MNARVVHHPANTLGEGILWCEREQALYWTDIQAAALWRHRPADGETRRWDMPERLGAWPDSLRATGRQPVQRRIAGYVKMMDAAHANRVAHDFIDACIECARSMPDCRY